MMDGDRRNKVLAFYEWQMREPDYPPPIDVWELDRQAMLREMQPKRSYLRAALKLCGLVALILFCWWRW